MFLMVEDILLTKDAVSIDTIKEIAEKWHGGMAKGVADIKLGILALGGEWHMDANNLLIENGSKQENLWGFNIYPNEKNGEILEYISLINIRPAQGNTDMEIQDAVLRRKIKKLVQKLIPELSL